jgi:hypothetical protein
MNDEELVSISEAAERYETEDIELSTDLELVCNISICKHEEEDGSLEGNIVMLSVLVEDEYVTFGYLQPPDPEEGWSPEVLAQLLQINPKKRIWSVERRLTNAEIEEALDDTQQEDEGSEDSYEDEGGR